METREATRNRLSINAPYFKGLNLHPFGRSWPVGGALVKRQVGYATYVGPLDDWDACVKRYRRRMPRTMRLMCMAYRLDAAQQDEPREILHSPRPWSPDPYESIGTVGYKTHAPEQPWWKGWVGMLWARLVLRVSRFSVAEA